MIKDYNVIIIDILFNSNIKVIDKLQQISKSDSSEIIFYKENLLDKQKIYDKDINEYVKENFSHFYNF